MNRISKIISTLFGLGLFFVYIFGAFAQEDVLELPDNIFVDDPAYEELRRCVPNPPMDMVAICYEGFYTNVDVITTNAEHDFFLNDICGYYNDPFSGGTCLFMLAQKTADMSVCYTGKTDEMRLECASKYYRFGKIPIPEKVAEKIKEKCKDDMKSESCLVFGKLCVHNKYEACNEVEYEVTYDPFLDRGTPEPIPETIEDCNRIKTRNCVDRIMYSTADVDMEDDCTKLESENMQKYCLTKMGKRSIEAKGTEHYARWDNVALSLLYLLIFFGISFAKRRIVSPAFKSILTVFQIFLVYALIIRFLFLVISIFWSTGRGIFDATGEPSTLFAEILSMATLHMLFIQSIAIQFLKIKLLTLVYLIGDLAIGIIFSFLLGILPISQTAKKAFAHVIFWGITIILNIFLLFLFAAALG